MLNETTGDGRHGVSGTIRQFAFVVGSPEQESNFKKEIEQAKSTNPNAIKYPTLLAFHGELAVF